MRAMQIISWLLGTISGFTPESFKQDECSSDGTPEQVGAQLNGATVQVHQGISTTYVVLVN
jgi:hypothetical protein